MSESKKKINKINYLSFLLACLVVLMHSVNIEVYGLSNGILFWVEKWVRELSDVAVPTFFIVSGFLFYQNYRNGILPQKWRNRFFSLVIPYIYYQVLFHIPLIRMHINADTKSFSIIGLIKCSLLGTYNTPTWFLRYLIVYTIICPLLFFIMRNKYTGVLLLVAMSVLSYAFDIGTHGYIRYLVFYLFGSYLGCNYVTEMRKKRDFVVIPTIILLFITIALLFVNESFYNVMYIPIRICQFALVWLIMDFFSDKKPIWWVNTSFIIYVTHSLILEAIEKLFLIAFGKTYIGAFLDFLLSGLFTVLLIIAIAWILRKFPPLWRVLTGNR